MRGIAAACDVFFEAGDVGFGHLEVDRLGEQQRDVDADAVADQLLDRRQALRRRRHLHHQVLAANVLPEPARLSDRA
ncbi:hypothetical protein ABH979_006379 [Bradyrhizobium ottawaense]